MVRLSVIAGGLCIGCTSIAGLDGDYTLGQQSDSAVSSSSSVGCSI